MKAIQLKTEYMINPRGIDGPRPFLSWICQDGITQTAYEISGVSAGTDKPGEEIWNSGKVMSGEMYALFGRELSSRQYILWKIRLWDEKNEAGEWSEPASFEMGLLKKKDFAAKWINPELTCNPKAHKPASCGLMEKG